MELEEKNFELLLKEKMHKELIKKLDSILKKIDTNDTSLDLSGIEVAISQMTVKEEISEIPKSILALSNVILDKIQSIKIQSPTEWDFVIQRDNNGFIESVKATGSNGSNSNS